MKKGWEIKTLCEVCKTGAGGTPLKSHKEFYEGGTIPWLMSGEVSQGEIFEAQNFITEKGLNNSSARLFPVNTVLIAMYGATAGQVGILRFEAATNQAVCGILPNEKMIPEYLFYCFLSKKEELISQASGNAQPNISQIKIKNTKIPIPPLSEQERIVSILDEAFAAIDQAKENMKRNLQNAKDLFQSELNAVFSNKGEGWVEKKLMEIGKTQTGNTPSTKEPDNYGDYIPFIKPGHFKPDGSIDAEDSGLSKKGMNSARLFDANSILMVCIGATIGKTGYTEVPVSSNQQINGLTPNQNFEPRYFYYALTTDDFFKKIIHGSSQATLPIINKSKWESLTVPFPKDKIEQKRIVHQLDTLSTETKKLETLYQQKLNNLEDLKKSILEKAFKGELKERQLSEL